MSQSSSTTNDQNNSDYEYIEEDPDVFDVDEYEEDDSDDEEENKE